MTNFDLKEIWEYNYLPLEYEIVYLSWHAFHHGFTRILWICDLAGIIKNNIESINWKVLKEKSINFNVKKQLLLGLHLIDILIIPSFSNKSNNQIGFPTRRFSEGLFLMIQNRVKNKKDEKKLRHLLAMLFMKKNDLKTYIPNYLRYRLS
jgi:hypothetical protein